MECPKCGGTGKRNGNGRGWCVTGKHSFQLGELPDKLRGMRTIRRHFIIPDTQVRPGVPMDHLRWVAQSIIHYRPDVIVHLGDHWDMPSLSSYDGPGSLAHEGARYEHDIAAGMEGMRILSEPILAEIERHKSNHSKRWNPRMVFLFGNHEDRITRAINQDARYAGTIGLHHCNVAKWGWEAHPFKRRVEIDGVNYCHYFQAEKSDRPIGGSMDNRFNKICATFVCGHEQGLLTHRRPLPIGRTIHGIVAGSCYIHDESYRGPQRNNEWRGIVVLNDVRNHGDCEPMAVTLDALCRKYEKRDLDEYLRANYPDAIHKYTLARAQ